MNRLLFGGGVLLVTVMLFFVDWRLAGGFVGVLMSVVGLFVEFDEGE